MITPSARASWGKATAIWLALATAGWNIGRWASPRSALSSPAEPAATARPSTKPVDHPTVESEFQRLRRLPGGLERRLGMELLLEAATFANLPTLAATGGLGFDEAARLIRQWTERDPAGCWAWYLRDGRRLLGTFDPSNPIMHAWARRDPARAMQALRALPRNNQTAAARGVLGAWASDEAGAAAAIAPHLEALAFIGAGLGEILHGRDPAAIGTRLLALPAGPGRSRFLHELAAHFFHHDWRAAVAWAKQAPASDQTALMESFATNTLIGAASRQPGPKGGMRQDEAEKTAWAQQWLADQAGDGARIRLGSHFAASIAATDPAAALQWAQDSLGGLSLVQAVAKVIGSQAAADPSAAIMLVDSLPPGGLRLQATEALASQWLKRDADAAVNWALAQGPDAMTEGGWMSLGSQWSDGAPGDFKASLAARPESVPPAALRAGIESLVRQDAPATVTWAATLPLAIRDQALQAAFNRWSINNPLASAGFVTDSPALPLPAASATQIANRLHERNPTLASEWALALPYGPARDAAVAALRQSSH